MKFTVEIRLGNDAMQEGGDVAEVLRKLAASVEDVTELERFDGVLLRDVNGNSVGRAEVNE